MTTTHLDRHLLHAGKLAVQAHSLNAGMACGEVVTDRVVDVAIRITHIDRRLKPCIMCFSTN